VALTRRKPFMSAAFSSGLSLSYRRFPISGSQLFTPFNRIFAFRGSFKLRHASVIF
jgi:hypothetical protein